jgi:hypothetical protein
MSNFTEFLSVLADSLQAGLEDDRNHRETSNGHNTELASKVIDMMIEDLKSFQAKRKASIEFSYEREANDKIEAKKRQAIVDTTARLLGQN